MTRFALVRSRLARAWTRRAPAGGRVTLCGPGVLVGARAAGSPNLHPGPPPPGRGPLAKPLCWTSLLADQLDAAILASTLLVCVGGDRRQGPDAVGDQAR